MWFVIFDTEEDCLETATYLETQTFNGKPIAFRIKSESIRSEAPRGRDRDLCRNRLHSDAPSSFILFS